ncbi:MAG TPA: tetratricopeptide repeat protein [Burkholderiales bacterium]|nr:tetratricopeptide repeat protein [Burkholderiales bacterium]
MARRPRPPSASSRSSRARVRSTTFTAGSPPWKRATSAARALFAREVAREPEYHEFHFWLGLAEFRLGNLARARAELEAALENSTTANEHDLYATKLQRLSLLKH